MTTPKQKPEMRVLKTATCKTLSGKSTLTYQTGAAPNSIIHLRIAKNSGGGFFSDEWISTTPGKFKTFLVLCALHVHIHAQTGTNNDAVITM